MSQEGYDEARDCLVTLMAMSAVGREQGWDALEMEKYHGSTEAMQATVTIAPEIGVSEEQQREDANEDRGRINEVMAVVRAGEDQVAINLIEARAATCYGQYGTIF